MAFATYGVDQRESSGSSIDFDEVNRYVVETAQLEKRETLPGVISSIIDLGIQKQPDAEVKFDGSEEEEAEIIEKQPDTYFKDGIDQDTRKPVRLKCWPQKPIQCVTVSVDFPDILVDKGQFFGESNPLPLRLYMGGQFYMPSTGMVVGRPTPLRVVNLDKTRKAKVWSLAQNSILYKMAVGAKIIEPGEVFLPKDIDQLLGKALQFEAQVFFKKSGDKEYYTEYVKYASGIGRGQSVPELEEETYLLEFNGDNPDQAVKSLRNHVVNSIKQAENYEGSKIKSQIDRVRSSGSEDKAEESDQPSTATSAKEEKAPSKPKAKASAKKAADKAPKAKAESENASDVDSFDDDIPW